MQTQRWLQFPRTCQFFCKRRLYSNSCSHSRDYDVVIAGGGIMGCSSAYFLAKRTTPSSICVVEKDSKYEQAATPLSVGSIRQQFSLEENILLSHFSYDFIRNIGRHLQVDGDDPPDVQFVDSCYLFLASERGEKTLRENFETQRRVGAEVELLSPKLLKELYPWMRVHDVALGCRGQKNEGWFDPWLYLQAFRKKIISMGVNVIDAEVTGLNVMDNMVREAKIALSRSAGNEEILSCRHFVNATGPSASKVALMAGIGDQTHANPTVRVALPVAPRRRCVFVIKCPSGPEAPEGLIPLVVDTNGAYFRSETSKSTFITGISPPEHKDCDGLPLEVDYTLFDDTLWPGLANRVPAFEAIKHAILKNWELHAIGKGPVPEMMIKAKTGGLLRAGDQKHIFNQHWPYRITTIPPETIFFMAFLVQSAWAGYYDYNTLDQNAIIGAHPVISNFIFANGFSGHGIQQSPAVGRAVSEIILDGKSHSIDLSRFSFQRIIDDAPLKEKNIV